MSVRSIFILPVATWGTATKKPLRTEVQVKEPSRVIIQVFSYYFYELLHLIIEMCTKSAGATSSIPGGRRGRRRQGFVFLQTGVDNENVWWQTKGTKSGVERRSLQALLRRRGARL